MDRALRDEEWSSWMRAALAGDGEAYRRFLKGVTPHLRAIARYRSDGAGTSAGEAEDIVQEALLAIHLKRGTWDPSRPIGPWMATIVRNKMIDALRRRGRRVDVPIDDVIETLGQDDAGEETVDRLSIDRLLATLKPPGRDIVQAISIDGKSVRETAEGLMMSEGAVRVALHRALKRLAELYRKAES